MQHKHNNYAFIDGNNLYRGVKNLGWKLDYYRFRVYLKEKYGVTKAFYFLGQVQGQDELYRNLKNWGYELIFKPVVQDHEGKNKGNCDAELVLQAMLEYEKYEEAVIVTSDGDFYCLVKHLKEQKKLRAVISPERRFCSTLLKRELPPHQLDYLESLGTKLEMRKAA